MPERREVALRVDARKAPAGLVRDLAVGRQGLPGRDPGRSSRSRPRTARRALALGPDYRVKPVPDFFAEVKSLLGEAAIT